MHATPTPLDDAGLQRFLRGGQPQTDAQRLHKDRDHSSLVPDHLQRHPLLTLASPFVHALAVKDRRATLVLVGVFAPPAQAATFLLHRSSSDRGLFSQAGAENAGFTS